MQYNYSRRKTHAVKVGNIGIGGSNPIRIQSMTNTDTNDVEGSALQTARIVRAGGELVRLTTQGVKEAVALGPLRSRLEDMGCNVPLSADVHFNPKAAFEAARTADKVRINPGNFVDAARTFRKLEFTDEEYAAELRKIEDTLVPFLDVCRKNSVAVRLGVNHGSLSDRIMSRFGDTPEGMVESVMEFLEICRKENFDDVVISIKASNTVVMTRTVRLLAREMDDRGMTYPLHLGVTEAGDAEDGRIKSAVGIGALLAEGLGDTIRVSLSEPPENEIPVAVALRDYIASREGHDPIPGPESRIADASRDFSEEVPDSNGRFIALTADFQDKNLAAAKRFSTKDDFDAVSPYDVVIISSGHKNPVGDIMAWIDRFQLAGHRNPVILEFLYDTRDIDMLRIMAGADLGALLLNGYGSGISIRTPYHRDDELADLELSLLQAARLRVSKTEYISCPSCGRTLFDLQQTLREVKEATRDLVGLKIGVMGCIVNGPGEMADADYGYVGAGPGRVSIYRGKELVWKNIPTEEALPALLELIRGDSEG